MCCCAKPNINGEPKFWLDAQKRYRSKTRRLFFWRTVLMLMAIAFGVGLARLMAWWAQLP